MSSGRVLAGVVDPWQYVVCDVNAGVDGHDRDDPAGRGYSCGDEHRNYEAVAEGLYKNVYKMDAVRPQRADLIPWDLDLEKQTVRDLNQFLLPFP